MTIEVTVRFTDDVEGEEMEGDEEEEADDDEEFEDADAGFGRLMERFGLHRNNEGEDEPDPDQFKDAEQ